MVTKAKFLWQQGTMKKSVYDPALWEKQVAFADDLLDYAKLAVSITHDNFQTALLAGLLIPGQRYLITDYTTYRFIVGQSNDYYRWPVEPIYIQALDTNKVNPKGFSKTYPDEQITYIDRQSITQKNFYVSASLTGWVPSGNYTMIVSDATHITFSWLPKPLSQAINLYFQMNMSWASFYFNDSNRDVDWEIDSNGDFHLLTTEYNVDIWSNAAWNTNDWSTDMQEIQVYDDTTIKAIAPATRFDDFIRDLYRWAWFSIYDDDVWWNLYCDVINKWEVWDIDELTGDIKLLRNGKEINGRAEYNPDDWSIWDLYVEIADTDRIWIDNSMDLQKGTNYNGATWMEIAWTDESYTYLDYSNYWVDWEIDWQNIVLLGNTHDLTSDLLYLSGSIFGNSNSEDVLPYNSNYAEVNISLVKNELLTLDLEGTVDIYSWYGYVEKVNGYISARYNMKKNFFWDADFRGRKIYRYWLTNLGTYSPTTTYSYNNVVVYNWYYYICFVPTSFSWINANNQWFRIWPAENIYGGLNYQSYAWLQVTYDSNARSMIDYFDVASYDLLNTIYNNPYNASVKCSTSVSTDLNFYIRAFWNNSLFESDLYIGAAVTSLTYIRNTTGFFGWSIINDVTSSNVNYTNSCILQMVNSCWIKQLASTFTSLSTSNIGILSWCMALRITSSTIVDNTLMFFKEWCIGSTINVAYSVYCENQFNGNNILNSNSTSFSNIRLLNLPWYLSAFDGNLITTTFQNVALQTRNWVKDNKFFASISNIDWKINALLNCTWFGSQQGCQLDNENSTLSSLKFFWGSNIINSNQYLNFNETIFSSTASIVAWLSAFEFSWVTVLPTVDSYYQYPYMNINATTWTGTETACRVRAVYTTSWGWGSPYSWVMIVATRRRPATTGTLSLAWGGGDPTISYSAAYKMFNLRGAYTFTVAPAIGDVYSNSGQLYWYAGKDDQRTYRVTKTAVSGNIGLVRVTGSGDASITFNSSWEGSTQMSQCNFMSALTAQLGTFGCARLQWVIAITPITNNVSLEAVYLQNIKQFNEFPGTVQGWAYKYAYDLRTVTTNYNTQVADRNILANGTLTITLFSSTYYMGMPLYIKNVGTTNVTMNTTSMQTIDWATTMIIYPWEARLFVSDNVNRQTMGGSGYVLSRYIAKTANYTLTANDYTVDCTANTFTITLPTAVWIAWRIYNIKNTGTGTITVDANGTETIDWELTQSLIQWENMTIQSTWANWIIL